MRYFLAGLVAVSLPGAALAQSQNRAATTRTTQGQPVATPVAANLPWTGAYGGINFGIGGSKYSYPGNGEQPNGAVATDNTINTASGYLGGFQAGYNYQFGNNVVLGLEADFQWSSIGANYSRVDLRTDYEWDLRKSRLLYFGTIRGRVGYAFGPLLPYLTGGVSYGRTAAYDEEGGDVQTNGTFEPTTIGRAASLKWGWTVGAGLEYAIDSRWRVKTEYLLVDLGGMRAVDHAGSVYNLRSRANVVRLGLNYAFGDVMTGQAVAPAPLLAKQTFKDWTGFHVGVNLGAGGNGIHIRYLEQGEGSRNMNSFGFTGGAEVGYDWQFSNAIVVGGVIDGAFTSIEGYRKKIEPPPDPAEPPGPVGTNGLKYRIKTLSNARVRVGYAMGPFLPYLTAGFAVGLTQFGQYDPADKVSMQQKRLRYQPGVTAGAGFEYALGDAWTFKADYLYYNLNSFNGFEVDLDAFKTKISFSTVRAGLNYRF